MKLVAIKDLLPGTHSPAEIYFRMTNEQFASTIDDIGPSFLYGGRYNPAKEFGVLYLSVSRECAFKEKLRQVKGRKDNLSPQIVASFNVKIVRCLSLVDQTVLQSIGIVRDDLTRDNDFSVPQNVAREARNVGFEALVAPSAAGDECGNLVVFKDRLAPPSFCLLKPDTVKPYKARDVVY